MKKIVIFTFLFLIGLFPIISAMNVDYFYSPTCSACNSIKSLVSNLYNKFDYHNWNFLDITKGSYNVGAVPTIKIKTDDCREIELIGTGEIDKYLKCELQEMSTLECPTHLQLKRGSYFIE